MKRGQGGPEAYPCVRRETRIPIEVGVQVSGHKEVPGVEMTFTQNVSERGARIFTSRRWRPNDFLLLETLTGSFRSAARVAYCEVLHDVGFAVGVEFLQASGRWVIPAGVS